MNNLRRRCLTLLLSLAMIITYMPLSMMTAYAAAGDEPAHNKTLVDNKDGTYTLALDVTGEAEKQPNNVNVIVIVDRSGSMGENAGSGQTRMSATQAAVNNLANTLLSYNGKDGNPSDTVEMALVSFATTATTNIAKTTDYSTFSSAVNNLRANGGTNWEDGLDEASDVSFGDNDPTFVIFFSDGAPTFHSTDGGYNNWNRTYGVYGSGQEENPNMNRSYTQAVDDAKSLADKVGAERFYTIFAYGETYGATYMTNLTSAAGAPAGNNYSASDTAGLQAAFTEILAKIEMSGIGNVEIDDGTTNQVKTSSGTFELLEVDEDSYRYWRAGGSYGTGNEGLGTEWLSSDDPAPPEAELVDGVVEWDLSKVGGTGILENGVKYTVTFDVYPSQTTYDIIAQLKNGDLTYGDTTKYPQEVWDNIVDNGGGSYSLLTNTDATLSYDDTRDDDGQQEVGYKNPDPVKTDASTLTAEKKWEGGEADDDSITMTILMDDKSFHTTEMTKAGGWKTTSFISVGIIKNGQVLSGAEGHDFKFAELDGTQYHWELDTPTVHPMLVDGTLTMLVKKDATHPVPSGAKTYTINNSTYYVDSSTAGLTATNHRRSNLNLTKVVTGEDAPENTTFPFTLNVKNSKADDPSSTDLSTDNYVWFSVWDGDYVDALVSGAEKEMKDGSWTGFYYAKSEADIVVNLKAGDNLRFTNLPSGSTYTFTEGTLPTGFAFNKSELTEGTDTTFTKGQTSTGTIQNTKTSYTVTYTNDYQLTDLEITKTWVDNSNQDGKRPSAENFAKLLTLSPAVQGATPAVKDNGDNTYTITYTGLPRFNNNEEVVYQVTEAAIEGYTTEGSPAKDHGNITNTHTPETTEVTVVKVWDDSDDIGGIRPASINAQLMADNTASGNPVTLNEGNKWTYTWEDLPKYKDGTEIVYSADETAVPAGYDKTGPVKKTADDGSVTFTVTNTYNPTPVSVDPPVQKVITGNDDLYNKGDFTFTIEAVTEGAPMPKNTEITNSADYELEDKTGYYEFGEIEFTMPGTYEYKITESGDVDGVTNDDDAEKGKTLTFTVEDDGEGNLTVSPTTDQVQLSFTNVYDADGEATIVVSKAIEGAAWPEGKTLTLTIAGADGAPMPETKTATLSAAGNATFGPIAYGLSDKGKTYTYTITESSFGAGWTGSPENVTATVKVTDNGDGTLKTEVTYSPEEAQFTNTYKATGSATLEVEKAVEGAAWPEGKTLKMTLAGTDSAPMPAKGGETATLTEEGKATFGEIAYTEADAGKTYTYTISEDGFGDGWTGSGDVTATVKVTDNGDGTLKTEVTYSPETDKITNTYDAEGTAELEVKKAIAGAEWPEGKTLTFTLSGEGGTLPENKTATLSAAGTAKFAAIKYDESDVGKTYTYTITEDGFGAGWTGSGDITATVKVSDNGDGTLKTEVSYSPENDTITNTYKASGKAELEVTKALEGAGWPAGKKLTFTLDGKGGTLPETKTVELTKEGKATFGAITYDESDAGKTYTYTIKEDGFGDGWTGSGDITATVKVIDNGDGTLKTEVTYSPENDTITNTYQAEGEAVLKVSKVIGSAEWPAGKTLTFTLAGEGGTLPETKTVTLKSAGTAVFDAITYDESDIGKTYTYTISEDGFGDGWTGSGDVTATVKVTDNGDGTVKADVTYSPDNDTITNTYQAAGDVTLKASKTLTGRDWKEGESYTFTLYDKDGKKVEEKEVTKNGEVTFSKISYTLDNLVDASGNYSDTAEYKYTISETSELPSGVEKSADVEATVKLKNNGDGTIGTSVTYSPENATITNTYTASAVKAQIKVDKKITGYKPDATEVNGEFKMILTPVDGAPMPEGKDTLETTVTTENGEGSSVFDEIEYTEAGEYTYKVKEEAGDKTGMTYDSNEYTVKVKVTDDLNGKLVAEVEYSSDSEGSSEGESATSVEITNDFQIDPAEVTLSVTKLIEDMSESAGEATFTFVLKDSDKAVVDEKTITTKGSTGGSVDFDTLTFTKDGTYTYYIQESVETEEDGWTYDTKEYSVQIVISDNLTEAKLVNDSVTYDGTKSKLEITNIYQAEPYTVSDITVNKTIEDTSGSAYETTFTFTLTGKDGAPMPENNKASVTGEGPVTFEGIEYTKVGTYEYTVKEEAADAKGYIYDTKEYDVTVTVTDEGGHLVADVSYGEDESGQEKTAIDIINIYDPEDAKAKLKATKIVNDKVGSAPDETFKFELVDPDGNVVETVTRENGGPVEFTELTFDKVGTYKYVIREVAGNTPGYKYDTAEKTVTITVTDPDKDGVLKASVEGNDPEIENPYEVDPGEKSVTDDISITKTLTGRDLEDGEFTFVLQSADGETILTATNDADGTVTFAPVTFDKVGEYTFTVREVTGDLEDVTYDTSVYTVVAKVTDPHNGEALEVEWTCSEGKAIEFINDYEPPEEHHKKKNPDTGDSNNLGGWLAILALAGAGGAGLYVKRRREDQ